jgi:hypothetical protein
LLLLGWEYGNVCCAYGIFLIAHIAWFVGPSSSVVFLLEALLTSIHLLCLHHHQVLRRIFGYKGEEVMYLGTWRKCHYEKLCNLHSLPNIINMLKLRRMRLARLVTQIKET